LHYIKACLTDPQVIKDVIDRYLEELKMANKFPKEIESLIKNRETWTQAIVKQLEQEQFAFSLAIQKRLQISKRKKLLFTFNLEDLIVLKVLLFALAPTYANYCSKNLYSYIRGRSVRQPIENFCKYLNKQSHNNRGGLWLYKTDLHHYYETIPVHSQSIVWPKLDQLLQQVDQKHSLPDYYKALLSQAIRPSYLSAKSYLASNLIGIPFGSPFSSLIGNLYCDDLDQIADDYPDAFYARYADDLLVAHSSQEILEELIHKIHAKMEYLRLLRKPSKEKYIYFSKSGLHPPSHNCFSFRFKGSNTVKYLGCVIHANGSTHSTARKVNLVLFIVNKTIQKTLKINSNESLNEKGIKVCQTLKEELLFAENKLIIHLFLKTNSHKFLKDLDLRIAALVAESLTKIPGRKAFQKVPYHVIRRDFGLPSLCRLRNEALL